MIAADLFHDPNRRSYASMPEADALTENGALQEVALVDVRFDATSGFVGLLFDLRGAIQLRDASVALLIACGVSRFEWINERSRPHRTWHAVTGSCSSPIPESSGAASPCCWASPPTPSCDSRPTVRSSTSATWPEWTALLPTSLRTTTKPSRPGCPTGRGRSPRPRRRSLTP